MIANQRSQAARQTIERAGQLFHAGDSIAAERLLAPLVAATPPDAAALNLLGVIRVGQRRFEEAAAALSQARAAEPRQPWIALNLANALAGLGRYDDSIAAFRAALGLKPDFAEALYGLGSVLHQIGKLSEAESAYRKILRLAPGNLAALQALGAVLIDAGRFAEAESALRRGVAEPGEARLKAALHHNLATAQRRQNKNEEGLANLEKAQALNPALPNLDMLRAEALEDLQRHDEALAVWRQVLAREPLEPRWHQAYNDLLYRLGREEDYLKSYDRAPRTRDLQAGKAFFLVHGGRNEEAHDIYRDMLARDPGNPEIAARLGILLTAMKRPAEALGMFESALKRGGNAEWFASAAVAAIHCGDPGKAVALCEQGLGLQPGDQMLLANMGTALRLMEDERDEILNGYDTLIRAFDLEPPEGFSDMASFNAELNAALDRLHPRTREYINQSLRGGTQTAAHLFGAGHGLVERLRARIDEGVARYIAELKADEKHPFLSRRRGGFAYSGSWSSRLKDCGYHVNHLHPSGWISSCYYVGVPEAVKDETAKQGWIKFGEPSFEAALKNPVRRAIQPVPGRLVLFPSYMWHGTVPFHDSTARTTVAFDAVPVP